MKKALSVILCTVIFITVLCFTACKSSDDSSSGGAKTTVQPTTAAATQPATEAPEPLQYDKRNKTDMSKKRGVYYEIFVRAFADSDGDKIGDFNGITAKLDYLKDLGVEGLWLMPINESDSYHGYDVTDYNALNSDYGTEEDFEKMLEAAHERGIKVIMDFVVNHTAREHPWFVASRKKDPKYRDYYTWADSSEDPNYSPKDKSPWGSSVWQSYKSSYYFGMFGGGMPDLNLDNQEVRSEIKKSAQKWLELGVDGFRLDACMHVYGQNEHKDIANPLEKNLEWWNEFAIACEEINPDIYLVGEAWQGDEALAEYAQPFDTKFDFAFEETFISALEGGEALDKNRKPISEFLENILNQHYAADSKYIDGVFATNHDQNRVMSQVSGNIDQAKLAANVYLTIDGNPYIYYGEEIGMKGEKPDENIREPFKWTSDGSGMDTKWKTPDDSAATVPLSEQKDDPNSLYNYYKKLISIRKGSEALSSGEYKAINTGNESIMAYSRTGGGKTVYVLNNFSAGKMTVNLDELSGGKVIFSSNSGTKLSGKTVTLDKHSSIFIEK